MLRYLVAFLISSTAVAAVSKTTYSSFKKVALEAKSILEDTGDDCHFSVTTLNTGLRLSISSTDGNVFVFFPANASYQLKSKTEADGSFTATYSVKGIGSFTRTHVDDAYDLVDITSDLAHLNGSCSVTY